MTIIPDLSDLLIEQVSITNEVIITASGAAPSMPQMWERLLADTKLLHTTSTLMSFDTYVHYPLEQNLAQLTVLWRSYSLHASKE